MDRHYGTTTPSRRSPGHRRTAAPSSTAQAEGWSAPRSGSGRPHRHSLRAENGHSPGVLPVTQPAPARHARATAHLGRQQLPRDTELQHEDDDGQAGAIRNAGPAAFRFRRLNWHQRFDPIPQCVRDQGLAYARDRRKPGSTVLLEPLTACANGTDVMAGGMAGHPSGSASTLGARAGER